jgi:hypothetical protein
MKNGKYHAFAVRLAIMALTFAAGYFMGSKTSNNLSQFEADQSNSAHASEAKMGSKNRDQRFYRPTQDEINANMSDRGLLAKAGEADYNTLSDGSEVTSYALKLAGVEASRKDEVQVIFDHIRAQLDEQLVSRIMLDRKASNPESGEFVFSIPAFEVEGESLIINLQQKLSDSVGAGAAKLLLAGLHPSRQVSGFGNFDTRIKIVQQPNPDIGQEDHVWQFESIDPKSGKTVRTNAMTTTGDMEKYAGKALARELTSFIDGRSD